MLVGVIIFVTGNLKDCLSRGDDICYWKSKGLSDERINSIKTLNHSITPNLDCHRTKTTVKFNESC